MNHSNKPSWWHIFLTNWVIADPNLLILDENSKAYKNYQIQKYDDMKHIYIFGGRLRIVKQFPRSFFVGFTLVALGILYYIFEAKWVWYNISPALPIIFSYFWFLAIAMFIRASFSDPGILPRNIHLPRNPYQPIEKPDTNSAGTDPQNLNVNFKGPDEYFNTITLPYYKDTTNGVQVKYCATCHIWRPPRTSHCGVCNVCVVNHDHHCNYVNNCIGIRNYQYFLWFTLSTTVSSILLIIMSALQIFHYRLVDNSQTFKKSITKYPIGFFLMIMTILSCIYPVLIFIVHVVLTAQNLTTREYLNNVRPSNDYIHIYNTHNVFKNWYLNWVGKVRGISYFKPTGVYTTGDIKLENLPRLT